MRVELERSSWKVVENIAWRQGRLGNAVDLLQGFCHCPGAKILPSREPSSDFNAHIRWGE